MENGSIHVLLIEDDSDFVYTTKERLSAFENPSFFVDSADSLSDASKRLLAGGIDAVVLDLNLKDSNGLETLTKLHSQFKNLPIIVLTGEYDESTGPETLKRGAQDYFVKGKIELSALARAIRYAIERKQHEESLRRAYHEMKELLDSVPSILIRTDSHNTIIYWNDAAEHILNITWKEAINKPLQECGVTWNYNILKNGITNCHLQKRPLRLDDIEFKRSHGGKGFLGITVSPIEGMPGEQSGTLIFGADITERKRLEVELNR
jgi:PAS domain S-box-containing protein